MGRSSCGEKKEGKKKTDRGKRSTAAKKMEGDGGARAEEGVGGGGRVSRGARDGKTRKKLRRANSRLSRVTHLGHEKSGSPFRTPGSTISVATCGPLLIPLEREGGASSCSTHTMQAGD